MRGLMRKDFALMMLQRKLLIMVLTIGGMLGATSSAASGSTFVVAYVGFIFILLATSTISYDELDNGETFLMTLPVTRREFIREKYLFGIIVTFIGWGIGVVLKLVFGMISGHFMLNKESVMEVTAILLSMILFLALILPVILKFGQEKGRIVWIVITGIMFILGYAYEKWAQRTGMDVSARVSEIFSRHSGQVFPFAIILVCLLTYISYRISCKVWEKKEF